MTDFVKVAKAADVPDPGKIYVEVDQQLLVLIRVDDQFYCLDDVCTHDGGPLGEGTIDGQSIACPRHGAKFDLRSGRALTMPATEPTRVHEVKLEDGDVWVKTAT